MNFESKVIVITGAGRGIGAEYARFFAARKAKLVLNDYSQENGVWVVDALVSELSRQHGIQVIANHDSVEDGHKIIEAAIAHFKRIDVLINNAGILLDRGMTKVTPQEFDTIIRIHLKGSFRCSLAAWPYFRKQKFGRIINTTSSTGLYGNFGQVNYAAAKAGLIGMTMAMAKEGANYNIKVNAIAPIAETRMTKGIIPDDLIVAVPVTAIPPFVAVLASDECPDNGQVYEVGGGWAARLRWERAEGGSFALNHTPEDIQKNWEQVGDFGRKNDYPNSGSDSIERMIDNFEKQASQKDSPPSEKEDKNSQMKPKL